MNVDDVLRTSAAVAAANGVARRTVQDWANRNGRGRRYGGTLLLTTADADAFAARNRRPGRPRKDPAAGAQLDDRNSAAQYGAQSNRVEGP